MDCSGLSEGGALFPFERKTVVAILGRTRTEPPREFRRLWGAPEPPVKPGRFKRNDSATRDEIRATEPGLRLPAAALRCEDEWKREA